MERQHPPRGATARGVCADRQGPALLPIIEDMRTYGERWLDVRVRPSRWADAPRWRPQTSSRRRVACNALLRRAGAPRGEAEPPSVRLAQLDSRSREFVAEASAAPADRRPAAPKWASKSSRRAPGPGAAVLLPATDERVHGRALAVIAAPRATPGRRAARGLRGARRATSRLLRRSGGAPQADARARRCWLLLGDVFDEQSEFEFAERLEGALAPVGCAEARERARTTLVATLHGMAIASPQVQLTSTLRIARSRGARRCP